MTAKFASRRPLTEDEEAEIQRMIASDPDAPEASDAEIAEARPFAAVFPEMAASIDREIARRGPGRPPVESPKVAVTIRVEPEVLQRFQAQGKDWRSRMTEALRKAAGL
ncbi:BrnA antitoxin family protein [Allorhizobium pseudoryzae]|uniref:BrnA antitoxin family protein n=1 Tax=Allorhizobium pseudoryzae TaxID=379684 RepID=UPI003D08A344